MFIAKTVENIVLLGTLAGVVLTGAFLTSFVSLNVGVPPTRVATFLLVVVPSVVLVAGVIAVLAPIRPLDSIAGGTYFAVGFGLLFVGGLIGILSVGPSVPRIPDLRIGPTVAWLGDSDATDSNFVGRVLTSELRIGISGRSRLWQFGLIGLPLGGASLPADTARAVVLPVARIWPLFVWSSVGVRADRHKTRSVIGATRYGHRQPTAELAAAALTGFVAVSGVIASSHVRRRARGRSRPARRRDVPR